MRRLSLPVFLLVCFCAGIVASRGFSGQVVSTMRNVNAVMEARGYRLQPAPDYPVPSYPGDHAPAQAFELMRPRGEAVKIGRLYTSCTCVRLETEKNSFARNERAIFILRNVLPTPVDGQMYAMYIQVTSPLRTTLRYDTFFQSSVYAPIANAPLIVGDVVRDEAPVAAAIEERLEEEAAAALPEPVSAEPSIPESEGPGDFQATERKASELKVTEVTDSREPVEDAGADIADDGEVDDYVSKFLELQAETTADEAGRAVMKEGVDKAVAEAEKELSDTSSDAE